MKSASINTASDTEVVVERDFDASVDRVWKIFTDANMVRQWMLGPPGWSMPTCELDFCVGGEYRNVFRNEEHGLEILISGTFREIDRHLKIIQDESHVLSNSSGDTSDRTVVTITFEETNFGATVTTLIAYQTKKARDEALATGMGPAMEMGYQRIDELLAV